MTALICGLLAVLCAALAWAWRATCRELTQARAQRDHYRRRWQARDRQRRVAAAALTPDAAILPPAVAAEARRLIAAWAADVPITPDPRTTSPEETL